MQAVSKYCLKCRDHITANDEKYGLHISCFIAWFKVSPELNFISLVQQSTVSQDPAIKIASTGYNTSFFHGKFKKYSADLGTASFILKMRQTDAPELPEVEYLCNQIGHALGITVAEHFLINFLGDQTFVTRNFIKKGGTSSNLDHIYKYLQEGQDYNCEVLIDIIKEQTKRPYNIETFIRTVFFDALIGNHDRHGRNLGFIVMASTSALSPIYDNVSYLGLESGEMLKADFNPKGKVAVQKNIEPSIVDYVSEFKRLGYEEIVKDFYLRIKPTKIKDLIANSVCSKLMKDALTNMFNKRYQEFTDALN